MSDPVFKNGESLEPKSKEPPIPSLILKLGKFLLVGLPAFLLAIPLNWFLVEHLNWSKPLAYALVLLMQVTMNFFACVLFVFKRDRSQSLLKQFSLFMGGIMTARVLDWGIYTALVQLTAIHYLVLQFTNVFLFAILKFAFAKRTIEGKQPA